MGGYCYGEGIHTCNKTTRRGGDLSVLFGNKKAACFLPSVPIVCLL